MDVQRAGKKRKVHAFELTESNVFTAYTHAVSVSIVPLPCMPKVQEVCPRGPDKTRHLQTPPTRTPGPYFFAAFFLGPMYNWPTLWPLVFTRL